MPIDTARWSVQLRSKSVDLFGKKLLFTNFHHTKQEQDLSEPANCKGFGRIRHFRRTGGGEDWPLNPLPLDPACKALGLDQIDILRAQVFQIAVCNWRCWYCFVPFNLLTANPKYSAWLGVAELLEMYLDQVAPPLVIDLTGGQPDLIPEWVPWMMTELQERGLHKQVYLWSDDNLSSDYFWRYLSPADQELVATYPNYGRVCCFKGFDSISFAFNTLADPLLFEQQFELARRLLELGIDLYFYATFTTPVVTGLADNMCRFMDRLQKIDENLPLRTVPLNIQEFSPIKGRLDDVKMVATKEYQYRAIEVWQRELEHRFSSQARTTNITDIPIGSKKRRLLSVGNHPKDMIPPGDVK